jgi:tryptophanyl-tRNA synthetase
VLSAARFQSSSREPKTMTETSPAAYKGPARVLSGIQPSGALHLGNYLGAIVKFVKLQHEMECLYCVVDLHAITAWQDPAKLAAQTREIAAAYLASGVDPTKAIIFPQSAVLAHAELGWQAQGTRKRRPLHLPGAAGRRHPGL